jgi:polyribonucleotide nucleotidyltransferase
MDCGVPISRPVAGVAMGLVTDGEKYAILSDIQGVEDHLGDMDFKVAGTDVGVTALQMDIKIGGLTKELMAQALEQAHTGRMEILKVMTDAMPAPRAELSKWAPRMESIHIDPEKIGAIIGKGGSTIRSLEEQFDVSIDIQDDGTVFVAGVDGIKTAEALAAIRSITVGPELGALYTGKVVRITDFGVFVELTPGTDGLVHISQLSQDRIDRAEDVVQLGDEIMVMVTDIDESAGKVRLSRLAVLEGWSLEEARGKDAAIGGGGRGRRDGGGRGRRDGGGGGGNRRR